MDRKRDSMNKVVLVTGGSRGIGRSTVIEFAKNGYDVVINYVNDELRANSLKEEVEEKYNVKALVVKCDISNESDITGVSLEKLYDEHINDMCRWYAIPTELDTIPEKKLKYY
jgi:NAD(P)-dependent dehydrogenase (short-subunit alcohol dehydrogenase family)